MWGIEGGGIIPLLSPVLRRFMAMESSVGSSSLSRFRFGFRLGFMLEVGGSGDIDMLGAGVGTMLWVRRRAISLANMDGSSA